MSLVSDDAANIAKIREGLDMLVDGLIQLSFRRGDPVYIKASEQAQIFRKAVLGLIHAKISQRPPNGLIMPPVRH